jgi:hypothetical protein
MIAGLRIAEERSVSWDDIFDEQDAADYKRACGSMPHIVSKTVSSIQDETVTELESHIEIITLGYSDCVSPADVFCGDDEVTEVVEYEWRGPDAVVTRDLAGNITVVPVGK